jgi:putative nucleotidyltransferase with HDIG domain
VTPRVPKEGRRSLPVGLKVVLPFLGLSLVAGIAASALVGMQLASAARAQLDAESIRESDSVSASFATFEQRQLTDLRTFASTAGVPAASAGADADGLRRLILPAVTNQLPDPLTASAIGIGGKEIISVKADKNNIGQCLCTSGRELAAWPHVSDALNGKVDAYGPKYIGVQPDGGGPVLYTVGPIKADGLITGAMLVAEPLNPLLAELRNRTNFDVALFDASGQLIASNTSLPPSASLDAGERATLLHGNGFVHKILSGRSVPSEVFYIPWRLRHEVAGYAGVVVATAALGTVAASTPQLVLLVFAVVFVLTLLAGIYISRRITRPLANLLNATKRVAEGDLGYRAAVYSHDEIGEVSDSFNRMTEALAESHFQAIASAEATIQTLASALDARDPYTHGHSMRVTAYSVVLARAAGWDDEVVELVRRGSLVHDIGKIGVPDSVLAKNGPLTDDEWSLMKRHPGVGHQMLRHLKWAPEVLDIVRSHHERWDGRGYPDRLAAGSIPAVARLVAVCDTLDAMTSDRPYRAGFTFEFAAAEIRDLSGVQFDPAMVEAFIRANDEIEALVRGAGPSSVQKYDRLVAAG